MLKEEKELNKKDINSCCFNVEKKSKQLRWQDSFRNLKLPAFVFLHLIF